MATNTGIEANAIDDLSRVHITGNRITVQFIEKCDTHGEIGVGEKLDCFSFARPREECFYIFLFCAFKEKLRKNACTLRLFAYDDAGGIEVIIERAPFT